MTVRTELLDRDRLRARLLAVLAVLITATVVAVGVVSVRAFDRAVEPELANRARLIGVLVRGEVQRATEVGIPFDSLAGLDAYLSETLARFEEIGRISVVTASGQDVATAERPSTPTFLERTGLNTIIAIHGTSFALPVIDGNRIVGEIRVDASPRFVQSRLRDVFLDVMVIATVAVVIALELALAIVVASVAKPLSGVLLLLREQQEGKFENRIQPRGLGGVGRAAARLSDHAQDLYERLSALPVYLRSRLPAEIGVRIAIGRPTYLRLSDPRDIRLALFLLSVGSEIAAAFLPVYARAALRPDWLSPEIAAAAPLLTYLGTTAALTPFSGALTGRVGARRLFVLAVLLIAVALAGMGIADSIVEIAIWRGVIGAAYALATVACQEYAIRASDERNAAKAIGGFVAVIYAGVFCGSAIGGVIAGRFGFMTAFAIAAAIVVLAGVLASTAMNGLAGLPEPRKTESPSPARGRPTARYLALLVGVAMPMNAATAILVWYLTPLMLAESGSGTAETARVVMLYYLAVVLFGPAVARLADRPPGPAVLVITGAILSGAALASLSFWDGFWAVASAVAGLGLGHTLIRAPQYAVALRIAAAGGPGLAGLRLFERLGAIVGLAVVALALPESGPAASIRALAIVVLGGAGLYAMFELASRFRRR